MEWKWNYGQGVLTLPAAVLDTDATPEQLRVLLWLAADPTLFGKPAQLARLAGCERDGVAGILRFWQDAEILSGGKEGEQPKPAKKQPATAAKPASPAAPAAKPAMVLARADELPNYSSLQVVELLEHDQTLKQLIDEAEKVWGKIFNPYELQILIGGISDHLGLDNEYILLLLAHCKRIEKPSLREVERYAVRLVNRGITNAAALEDFIRNVEASLTLEGKVRKIFGLGARPLSAKEQKMMSAWSSYGYDADIVRKAYDITVDNTGKASLPYANSILERWHSEGLETAAQIDAKLDAEREKKGQTPRQGSFDTDDFFEAALCRSYSDTDSQTGEHR